MSLFDSLAAAAVDVLASQFGDAGTFTPAGGSPIAVRVVMGKKETPADPLAGLAQAASYIATLSAVEVPTRPNPRDTLVVTNGEHPGTYAIGSVQGDLEGQSWECGVYPA